MAEPRHWHLILYDVSGDKAARLVHKKLAAWGKPMQFSAFRVRCTERELQQLRFELTKIMGVEDRLMVVKLCPTCAGRVTVKGKALAGLDEEEPPFIIL